MQTSTMSNNASIVECPHPMTVAATDIAPPATTVEILAQARTGDEVAL